MGKPAFERTEQPFSLGSLPDFHPLYCLYLHEGDCPKSTILPRTLLFFTFPIASCVPEDIVQPNSKSLLKVFFFTEDVVEAEVSPDEDPLRLPSLSLTQTTHRLATEHLQVNHHDHPAVGDDDYIDGDGDCAKDIGIRIGDISEKDCGWVRCKQN